MALLYTPLPLQWLNTATSWRKQGENDPPHSPCSSRILLSGFVYAVRPLDGPTIVGASLFLVLVGLAAALHPALRATRVSSLTAIREEV